MTLFTRRKHHIPQDKAQLKPKKTAKAESKTK
jgi:hypothetical protein